MKRSSAFLLVIVLLFTLGVPAFAAGSLRATPAQQKLSVDGRAVNCEIYSVFVDGNVNGNNFFKLRDVAYMLNGTGSQFSLGYDNATNTISITTGEPYTPDGSEMKVGTDKSSTVKPCAQRLMINGVMRTDLTAYTFTAENGFGNNFFKLRDLSDALGFDVEYDSATRTMLVTSRSKSAKDELSAEQIYAKCVPAVFFIEVYDAYGDALQTGSGFFIDANGTAVTNYHVIDGGYSAAVTVTDAAGNIRSCNVLGVCDYNEYEDWAILKIDGKGFTYLNFGSPSTAVGGATVYALGSPLGLANTLSQGLISNPSRSVDGQVYIQTTAAISPGSSGGALINKYGDVIGITSAAFTEGQNLNLAIPVSKLSNVNTADYVPISETCGQPVGTLEAEVYYIDMDTNDAVCDIITACKYDCDESTFVRWEVGDPYLIDCEWGEWMENGDDIPLYIYSGDTCGSTLIWLYYYTDSGTLLASDCILVNVNGGYLSLNNFDDYLPEMKTGATRSIPFTAYGYGDEIIYVSAYTDDGGIVDIAFGDWNGNVNTLYLTAIGTGSTYVNLELVDDSTGSILSTDCLYVTVS